MKKKVALLLIACMVVSSLGLTFGANASDIENHWAKETIKTWISNGLINGYPDGSFRPNNPITRAEFMVLVNKAFGFTERAEISYKDVSEGEWYYSTVARAVAAGYMGGYTDGSMKPNHPISRQEVTVVLSKITNTPQNPSAIDNFTDASAIANWAKGYVGAAAAKGYMGGYPDGSFKPTNNITRAEAVVTLNKALTAEVDEELEEEQEAEEIVYDEAGTYGPQTGRITITKDVIIKADGVTLQNMVIEGSLTIAEEVGDGEVYLNNVTVKGETFIRGGGKDSIYINGGQYNKITVQKTSSGNVRIVATNAAGLEIIISEAAAGEAIILEGSFDSITIEADDVNIVTQGETNIEEVVVKEGVSGTLVSLGNDTIITKLVADARIGVEGEGTIIETSGKEVRNTIFEKTPERITTPSSGGGGGGGGGGGSSIVAVSAINVTGNAVLGATLTAAPNPSNATGSYQWQRSDNGTDGWTNIGTNSNTYTIVAGDAGKYIRVTFTATGNYTGQITSGAKEKQIAEGMISIAAIPGVTAPATGRMPVTEIIETHQYTGTVTWDPAHNPFQAGTVYTANILLTAKAGWTLTGVAENFFTVAGATTTNIEDTGVVTAIFPSTPSAPTIQSANTNEDGTEIFMSFNKAMNDPINAEGNFYFTENAATRYFSSISLVPHHNSEMILAIDDAPIAHGASLQLYYSPGYITSTDGGSLASVTNYHVNNNKLTAIKDLPTGTIVYDSQSYWQHRTGLNYSGTGENEPVEWIVVAEGHYSTTPNNDSVTLLSNEMIGRYKYDGVPPVSSDWEDSELRNWLNTTFYNHFSNSFKDNILSTLVPNKTYDSDIISHTTDKVFMPSTTELGATLYTYTRVVGSNWGYFTDNTSRRAHFSYPNTRSGEYISYWTRSPGTITGDGVIRVFNGSVDDAPAPAMHEGFGVYPVININGNAKVNNGGEIVVW